MPITSVRAPSGNTWLPRRSAVTVEPSSGRNTPSRWMARPSSSSSAAAAQVADQVPVQAARLRAAASRVAGPSAKWTVPPIFSSSSVRPVNRGSAELVPIANSPSRRAPSSMVERRVRTSSPSRARLDHHPRSNTQAHAVDRGGPPWWAGKGNVDDALGRVLVRAGEHLAVRDVGDGRRAPPRPPVDPQRQVGARRDDTQLAAPRQMLDEPRLRGALPVPPLLRSVAVAERGGVHQVGVLVVVHAGVGRVHLAREPDDGPLHAALQVPAVPDLAPGLAAAGPRGIPLGRHAGQPGRVLGGIDADHRVGGAHQRAVQTVLARQVVRVGRAQHGALVAAADREPRDVRADAAGVGGQRLDQRRTDRRRLDDDAVTGSEPEHAAAEQPGETLGAWVAHRSNAASTASSSRSEPKRTGSSTTRPVSAAAAAIAARASASSAISFVFRAMAATRAGRTGSHAAS